MTWRQVSTEGRRDVKSGTGDWGLVAHPVFRMPAATPLIVTSSAPRS
jgi:hypothetical protein